jgi:hypothetical protein
MLRASAQSSQKLPQRLPATCFTAIFAALALYAGFAEEVYLYAFLLLGWTVLRMFGLSARHLRTFALDLTLSGILALALSAPLLVGFAAFMAEASVGFHGTGGGGATLSAGALLQYLFPYVYGPIFGSPNPIIGQTWGFIGGYIGLMPVLIAVAAFFVSGQRAVKVLLLAWIAFAISLSHGMPMLGAIFSHVPLADLTVYCRYLNSSWIFSVMILAALFLARIPELSRSELKQAVCGALVVTLLLAAMAAYVAQPLIASAVSYAPRWVASSFKMFLALSAGTFLIALFAPVRAAAVMLSALLIAEAATLFGLPYFSAPTKGELDFASVAFLQSHVGYHRVLKMPGHGLYPNYGSAFEIAQLNYVDLPVPQKTADYIREHLDPYADPVVFLPDYPFSRPPEQQAERQRLFEQRLSRYADVGVKYLMTGPDLESFQGMTPVFRGRSMNIFELPTARDYFSSDTCTLKPVSHDRVDADCPQPAHLTRLELHMRGWTATVNGAAAAIALADNTFQTIDLPAGTSHVEFAFTPPDGKPALMAALASLLFVLAVFASAGVSRLRRRALRY